MSKVYPESVDLAEAARLLGVCCRTANRRAQSGKMPTARVGRVHLVPTAFLRSQGVKVEGAAPGAA